MINFNDAEEQSRNVETAEESSLQITKDELNLKIGHVLKCLRRINGISQQKLGKLCGVSFQQIQKYEKGESRISSSYLFMISKILKVPINTFFDGDDDDLEEKSKLSNKLNDFLKEKRRIAIKLTESLKKFSEMEKILYKFFELMGD